MGGGEQAADLVVRDLGRLDLPDLAAELAESLRQAAGAPGAELFLLRPGGRHALPLAAAGAALPPRVREHATSPGVLGGPEGWTEQPAPLGHRLLALRAPDGSLVGLVALAPSPDGGEVAGAVRQAAWGLDAAVRWADQACRTERLAALQALTGQLATTSTADEVAHVITTVASDQLRTAGASLSLLSPDGTELRLVAVHGGHPRASEDWGAYPVTSLTPAAEAVRTGRCVVAGPDGGGLERYPEIGEILRATGHTVTAAPVRFAAETFGVLTVSQPTTPQDAAEPVPIDADYVAALAEQCAAALQRARLHDAERESLSRLELLTDASAVLGATLDTEEIVDGLLGLLVGRLADGAVIRGGGEGRWGVLGCRHADPAAEAALGDWVGGPDGAELEARVRRLAADGAVHVLRDADVLTPAGLAACCQALVPLSSQDGVLGALCLVHQGGTQRHLGRTDQEMLQELGGKIGTALRNSRVHAQAREVAVTLQRSLLPQSVPELPGMAFAWRYLPGAAGVHIGGDWYDAIGLENGCVGVLIGDVMGRGVRAAAIMGQLRATARAYASAHRPPAEVLAQLDVAVGGLEQGAITTALFGVLDPATGVLTVASAGHLPPLLVEPGGQARYLDVEPGPPLGAGPAAYPELTTTIEPGSTLLLFTDGLVEDRLTPVDAGLESLRAALDGLTEPDPEAACERALAGLGRSRVYEDDTAILALTVTGRATELSGGLWSWQLPPTAKAVGPAREALRRRLRSWGVAEDDAESALTVGTELASNAVLHAGGRAVLTVQLGAQSLRLEVRDAVPEREPTLSLTALTHLEARPEDPALDAVIHRLDQLSSTGRGMAIVAALAEDWGVEADTAGKTVWALLPLRTAPTSAPHGPEPAGTREREPDGEQPLPVWLRDVPVRLVLASSANLDELVREFQTGDPGQAEASLGSEGALLLHLTARTREPFRAAARDALRSGSRLIDVHTQAGPATVAALERFFRIVETMVEQCRQGRLLTLTPDPEVTAFRRWWAAEIGRQVAGLAPRPCPFPALPAGS